MALLAIHPIDAVLSDLRMPDMDGLELLERVSRGWPCTARVLLTARPDAAMATSAAELEALLINDLSPELRAKTDVVVLDVSAPERAKPKPKKAAQPAIPTIKTPAKRVRSTPPSKAGPARRGRAPRGTNA